MDCPTGYLATRFLRKTAVRRMGLKQAHHPPQAVKTSHRALRRRLPHHCRAARYLYLGESRKGRRTHRGARHRGRPNTMVYKGEGNAHQAAEARVVSDKHFEGTPNVRWPFPYLFCFMLILLKPRGRDCRSSGTSLPGWKEIHRRATKIRAANLRFSKHAVWVPLQSPHCVLS